VIEAETCGHLVTLNKINIHNTSCVVTWESLLLICIVLLKVQEMSTITTISVSTQCARLFELLCITVFFVEVLEISQAVHLLQVTQIAFIYIPYMLHT